MVTIHERGLISEIQYIKTAAIWHENFFLTRKPPLALLVYPARRHFISKCVHLITFSGLILHLPYSNELVEKALNVTYKIHMSAYTRSYLEKEASGQKPCGRTETIITRIRRLLYVLHPCPS